MVKGKNENDKIPIAIVILVKQLPGQIEGELVDIDLRYLSY
jgi:hypothetical protein